MPLTSLHSEQEGSADNMIEITIATSNPHKVDEINKINQNKNIIFVPIKGHFDPEENGNTFIENAIIKAKEGAKICGGYCFADDSGLCVDALDGEPGIYSARYAPTPEARINKLLNKLKNVKKEDRSAHFICAVALVDNSGNIILKEEGRLDGYIDFEPKGEHGFGYDPVFFVPEYRKTVAELPDEVKNKISHRAKAVGKMLKAISDLIKD